jgi:hypothetical protein
VEVKEEYHVKISNKIAALDNLGSDDDMDISITWGSTRVNITSSFLDRVHCYELKQYKQWFDEVCSKLLQQKN